MLELKTRRLITVKEAGEMLGLSPASIRSMCFRGVLPFVKLGTRRSKTFFDVNDIEEIINNRKYITQGSKLRPWKESENSLEASVPQDGAL